MLKKLLKVLLTLVVAIGLVACSSSDGTSKEAAGPNVHVFYYDYGDTYISTVRTALDTQLEGANVEFTNYDASGKQQLQTEQVQTAISSGATLLVVNIVETGSDDAATTIINAAKEKDIPVVFFNREVSDEVVNSYEKCSFIGTDAKEAGVMQGNMIGEELVANFDTYDLNGDGSISYAMFKGQEGNNEAIYRTQFAVENADAKLEAAGKSKLVYYDEANSDKYQVDQDGTWSAKAAQDYMATALGKYNEGNNNMIELVICNNDNMAEGAISALQTVGFNKKGQEKQIPVYGVDATKAAVDLIAQGVMSGTIKQDAEGMAKIIALAVDNNVNDKGSFDGVEAAGVSGVKVDDGVAKARIPYQMYTGK
ncbi:MAG: galactose ABC transporter substrate-binding protein [Anaerorhabdus sp.]